MVLTRYFLLQVVVLNIVEGGDYGGDVTFSTYRISTTVLSHYRLNSNEYLEIAMHRVPSETDGIFQNFFALVYLPTSVFTNGNDGASGCARMLYFVYSYHFPLFFINQILSEEKSKMENILT